LGLNVFVGIEEGGERCDALDDDEAVSGLKEIVSW
jgi:hypothetical protein